MKITQNNAMEFAEYEKSRSRKARIKSILTAINRAIDKWKNDEVIERTRNDNNIAYRIFLFFNRNVQNKYVDLSTTVSNFGDIIFSNRHCSFENQLPSSTIKKYKVIYYSALKELKKYFERISVGEV